ncbi:citrate lyase subunit alpha [Amphibacillus cookii]|uniref:citrate lyase subunit alpha n=1 Tax=Amphibacillus cookii TaxID=767787 RepID=UPI001EF9819E|nr:citrate lyase subunit alpha [Amphibacillus cookii]MBM7540202.1 citrate lyase subunit alpha/citrate CoA-transferase [Amphibacillus cookii]
MNKVKREIPEEVRGNNKLFAGVNTDCKVVQRAAPKVRPIKLGEEKLVASIEEVINKLNLCDNMTISFHHHFREGDYIINLVMDAIAKKGIKNLTIAPSSLTNVHAPLVHHIKTGVITNMTTSGLRGELGEAISNGVMKEPVRLRSHGGRARAIEAGDIKIDVAFLGVPSTDLYGNANGVKGKTICGSLGYAQMDAKYADQVVLLTDTILPYPNTPISIAQTDVDYIVKLDKIGDSEGIGIGATRFTTNPKELQIAELVKEVITKSVYFKNGFSFQTGTGGAALAVTRFLAEEMKNNSIKASFALGGITKPMLTLLEENLVDTILDVQDFDKEAAISLGQQERQIEISASYYADPHNKGAAVNQLDVVILSALEVDNQFNVNVMTGSDGVLRGAIGGHCDAANAKMTIISAPLVRGRIPTIVDRVNTVITPGESVDVIVTEIGIAINPKRRDLIASLSDQGIPIFTIDALQEKAYEITGTPKPIEYEDKVVALVEYRDGTLIDKVLQVKQ